MSGMTDQDFLNGLRSPQEQQDHWTDQAEHFFRLKKVAGDFQEMKDAERKMQNKARREAEKEKTAMSRDWLVQMANGQQTDSTRLEEALKELPFEEIEKLAYDAQAIESARHYRDLQEKVAEADRLGRELAHKHGAELIAQVVGQEKTAGLGEKLYGMIPGKVKSHLANAVFGKDSQHAKAMADAAKSGLADKIGVGKGLSKTAGIAGALGTMGSMGQKALGMGMKGLVKNPSATLGVAGAGIGAAGGALTAKPGERMSGALGGAAIGGGLGAAAGGLGAGKVISKGILGNSATARSAMGSVSQKAAPGAIAAAKASPASQAAVLKPNERAMLGRKAPPIQSMAGPSTNPSSALSTAKAQAGHDLSSAPDIRSVVAKREAATPAGGGGLMGKVKGWFGKTASGLASAEGETDASYFNRMMGL
jgi:hypothetical protein